MIEGGGEGKAVIGLSWQPKLISQSTPGSSSQKPPPNQSGGSLWKPNQQLVDGLYLAPNDPAQFNKLQRKQVKDTLGKGWFDMPAPTMTPELKKDLEILKLRGAIDPKRHYKKGDSKGLQKYFQVGTVVSSPFEFHSGRLTKKERKASIAEELLADHSFKSYRKRKVREIEEQNRPGGKDIWKIRGKTSMKRAKEKRR
ncbi:Deoxynucleotidyltransferase terminal-interacting protein 2 [Linum perenne]